MSDATTDRPLAISLLLGASGWVAGLFMLAFVAMLFHPNGASEAAVSGAVLLAAAWGLFKVDGDGAQLFVSQLALTLSIAGQCLMLFAMTEHTHGLAAIAGAAFALQVLLALAMPNRLHRTLSTLFATIAWALALRFAWFGEPRWRHGADAADLASWPVALLGWLATWVPVGGLLAWAISREPAWLAPSRERVVGPIVTGSVIGLAFATIASQPFESVRWFGSGDAQIGALSLWPLLSALGAMGAVAAAFALRRDGLRSVCIVAVLLHVSHFYYALGTSLLVKSMLMLAMGAVLLLAARALRITTTPEDAA